MGTVRSMPVTSPTNSGCRRLTAIRVLSVDMIPPGVSGGRGTAQTSPLQHPREPRGVEVGVGAVKQAAVVPHQQVARRPFVAIDETLLHRVLDEFLQMHT